MAGLESGGLGGVGGGSDGGMGGGNDDRVGGSGLGGMGGDALGSSDDDSSSSSSSSSEDSSIDAATVTDDSSDDSSDAARRAEDSWLARRSKRTLVSTSGWQPEPASSVHNELIEGIQRRLDKRCQEVRLLLASLGLNEIVITVGSPLRPSNREHIDWVGLCSCVCVCLPTALARSSGGNFALCCCSTTSYLAAVACGAWPT